MCGGDDWLPRFPVKWMVTYLVHQFYGVLWGLLGAPWCPGHRALAGTAIGFGEVNPPSRPPFHCNYLTGSLCS